jgi:uncharacterized protein YcfL
MKKSAFRFLVIAMLGIALLAGCSTVNTVEPANPEARPTRVDDKRIITDSDLNDIAYVQNVYVTTVSGNLKRVQVTIRNLTSTVKNVNYKFTWFDGQGIVVDSPMSLYQSVSIEGGASLPLTSTAPNPKAVDFKLELLGSVRR